MIHWLTQRLKGRYPFSEIARVIDLDRAEMAAQAESIQRVEAAVRQLGGNQSEMQAQLGSLIMDAGARAARTADELAAGYTSSRLDILDALEATGTALQEALTGLEAGQTTARNELSQATKLVARLASSAAENRQTVGGAIEDLSDRIRRNSELNAEVSERLAITCEGIRSATNASDSAQQARIEEIFSIAAGIDRQQTDLHRLLLKRLDELEVRHAREAAEVVAPIAAAISEQGRDISSLVRNEMERTRVLNVKTWLKEVKPAIQEAYAAVGQANAAIQEMQPAVAELKPAVNEVRAAMARANAAIQEMQPAVAELKPAVEEAGAAVEEASAALAARIDDNLTACRAGQWARTTGDERTDPEVSLLEYLAPFVRHRVAIDIGANEGLLSMRLARAGYRVIAFEPNPALSPTLTNRSAGTPGFKFRHEAIGAADGAMDLNLVEDRSGCDKYRGRVSLYSSLTTHSLTDDLAFSGSVSVPVRSIDSLCKTREIPSVAGVVKIDTEGYDLEVIRGMGALKSQVVVAEFWDEEMAFGRGGLLYRLPDLVNAMQQRGYYHHIILHRDAEGTGNVSFYTNRAEAVPGSWGNAVFLRSYALYEKAVGWCSSRFPRTIFHRERG